jgi:hypothetical protein
VGWQKNKNRRVGKKIENSSWDGKNKLFAKALPCVMACGALAMCLFCG